MYKKGDCEIRVDMLGTSSEVLVVQLQVCGGGREFPAFMNGY